MRLLHIFFSNEFCEISAIVDASVHSMADYITAKDCFPQILLAPLLKT